jgi:hypothetical protein
MLGQNTLNLYVPLLQQLSRGQARLRGGIGAESLFGSSSVCSVGRYGRLTRLGRIGDRVN